jgi:hypothetical protein
LAVRYKFARRILPYFATPFIRMSKNSLPFYLLLIAWLIVGSSEANAQFYVGPTLSASVSKLDYFRANDDKALSALPSPGFNAGITFSRRIKNKFVWNASLQYAQKFQANKNHADAGYHNKFVMRYVELPITYMVEFDHKVGKQAAGYNRDFKWFFGGGPVVSYWLASNGKFESVNTFSSTQNPLEYKVRFGPVPVGYTPGNRKTNEMFLPDANRFQFALSATAGFSLQPIGYQKIIIALNAEIGQSLLSKEGAGYFPASPLDIANFKAYIHTIRLSATYLFDLKIEDSRRGKSLQPDIKKGRKVK